jgi:hypothetical protein
MAVDVPVTSGLSVWLRADMGVLTNATGNVTNWQDQATGDGSQNATQGTATNQPLFVASASGLNNQPVVRFDGVKDSTGDRLLLGNLSNKFTTGEATLFVVYTGDSSLGVNYSVYSSAGLGGTYWNEGKVGPFYGTTGAFNYRYNENGSFGNYPDIPCAGNHIVEFRAGSDYTAFTNGVSLGTLTVANTAGASVGTYKFWGGDDHRIGNNSATTDNLNFRGDVAEIIIYSRVLTDNERNQVGAYLEARYRISGNYPLLPDAPSGLTAMAANSFKINLSWIDNSFNETGFKVERATDSGFTANLTLVTTTAADATNYTDTGLSATTTYYYRVRATNPAGDSGNSGSANATTLLAVVSDSLSVWLRADMGVLTNATGYVTNWQDQATFDGSQNGTNATAANQPLFVASATGLNNQPVVRFDGVKDTNGDRLLLGNLSNKFTTGEATLFVVYTGDSSLGANYSVYSSGPLGGTYWDQGKVGPFYGTTGTGNYRYNENGSFGNYPDIPCAGNHIVEFRAGSDYTAFTNGVSLGTLTVANTAGASIGTYKFWGGNDHRIGNNSATEVLNFRGDVAELVIYNRALNAAERVIIENCLSARYGMVLGANEVYTGDNGAKGDYDLDVIGIGSKTSDALAPGKISASENVAGLQLVELNGSLADGEFLLAGHKVAVNSWTPSDMPSGRQRSSRVWYVEKTGTVDATLTFDLVAAGLGVPTERRYSLMYSSNPTFSFSQVSDSSPTGSQVSFSLSGTELASGYYTIGEAAPFGTVISIK